MFQVGRADSQSIRPSMPVSGPALQPIEMGANLQTPLAGYDIWDEMSEAV